MSEDITYKVQIDSGTIVNVGSAQRYNISSLGLTPGSHTFKVIGTCKHNVERNAQKTFNYPAASPAANTLRFAFSNNSTSPLTLNMRVGTWTKVGTVGEYTNVWDWTNNESWDEISWGFTESFDPDVRIIDCGDTSNVTNMFYTFMSCNTLTDISGLANMDISNVHYLSAAFYGCAGLLSVDALSSWDVSHIGSFGSMFSGCTSLKSITALASWDVSGARRGIISMFNGCSSIESGMKAVYDSWSSLTTVPDHGYCFTGAGTNNASGMDERTHIPTSWGGDALN